MLHSSARSVWLLGLLALACTDVEPGVDPTDTGPADGFGGAGPVLTLPFPTDEFWVVTRLYGVGSHIDYGFEYGDDSFAVDFSQAGCDPYDKEVTAMASGVVFRVTEEGFGDSGYGNSVLVDHGGGYVSRYAHMSVNLVAEGDYVDEHTVVGRVCNTGYVEGDACPEHPGTHLHVAYYHYGVGVPPEPLSGVMPLMEGCWYNRAGESTCDIAEPVEDEEDPPPAGEVDITLTAVFPDSGSALETNYTWSALVESPDGEPSVSLWIDNDGDIYEFPMTTASTESPWIFTTQKVMDEAMDYPYWITASEGGEDDRSATEVMTVSPSTGDYPLYYYYWDFPSEGIVDTETLYWNLIFECEDMPDMTLHILNPVDGVIYDFDMTVRENTGVWLGMYNKTLSEVTTYSYWVVADNGVSQNCSEIGHVTMRDE